jgi:hypothetical protein
MTSIAIDNINVNVVVINFRGVTPTWRWGGRAVAGMLRCVALLRWR